MGRAEDRASGGEGGGPERRWLEMLRCPVTGGRLRRMDVGEWTKWGEGKDWADGVGVEWVVVSADGSGAYPVRGGIPILLEEERRGVVEEKREALVAALRLG
ncbi:MAG: hypothetical protein RLZZ142_1459 [Verrucomicrobiota bacterium]